MIKKILESLGYLNSPSGHLVTIVSVIHVVWAFIILSYGSVPESTTLSPFRDWVAFYLVAFSLVASSGIAIASFFWSKGSRMMLIPQQFILLVSSISVIEAVVKSQFSDGVVRDRAFVSVDQIVWLVLVVAYFLTVVRRRY